MNKEEAKNKWKGTGKTKYREYEKLHSYLRLIWLMIPEVEFWCLWFEEDRSQLKWERERIVVAIALIWRLRKESNLGTNSLYGMCVQVRCGPCLKGGLLFQQDWYLFKKVLREDRHTRRTICDDKVRVGVVQWQAKRCQYKSKAPETRKSQGRSPSQCSELFW